MTNGPKAWIAARQKIAEDRSREEMQREAEERRSWIAAVQHAYDLFNSRTNKGHDLWSESTMGWLVNAHWRRVRMPCRIPGCDLWPSCDPPRAEVMPGWVAITLAEKLRADEWTVRVVPEMQFVDEVVSNWIAPPENASRESERHLASNENCVVVVWNPRL